MRPRIGIVHLGLGAFFRAFGLPYLEDAMAAGGGDWGVLGVSLRSGAVRDSLVPNDCVYHAMERGPGGPKLRRIEALRDVLVLADHRAAILEEMAQDRVSLVTLTVTEKGYCHAPATGALDLLHPAIAHDIAAPLAPVSAPGLIVEALRRRRAAGLPGLTCLSCDNLPGNGALLRRVVLGLAAQTDPGLADWIATEARFPTSMVDRIVPATTDADRAEVAALTGIDDAGAVVHEPFRQWVIEDSFAGPRPAFEAAGVQIVPDVAPFEHMKLRCLNGTHSALAYLGVLAGKPTVSEAVADARFADFIETLWAEEIRPAVVAPCGVDLAAYTGALMERYRNPAIAHRTIQIAMDGSQKLPQRILATVHANLAAGRPVGRLALVIAGWIRFLRGQTDAGERYEVSDPLADVLQAAAWSVDPVGAVLAERRVFDADLAAAPGFVTALRAHHDALARDGVAAVLDRARGGPATG